MISRTRYILALILAIVVPGLGRAVTDQAEKGAFLFLVYVLLWRFNVVETWWLRWPINIALWSFFASIDVRFVVQAFKQGTKREKVT